MGDFNEISDFQLDSTNSNITNRPKNLINLLEARNFSDAFREIYPHRKEFSYTRPKHNYGSRIDYIWTSSALTSFITDTTHISANTITSSDHKFILTTFNTPHIHWKKLSNHSNYKQSNFDYINTSPKQWLKFNKKMETLSETILLTSTNSKPNTWNLFKNNILQTANKTLKKRTRSKNITHIKTPHHNKIMKETHLIGKTYRLFKKWTFHEQERNNKLRTNIENNIQEINKLDQRIDNPPFSIQSPSKISQEAINWLSEIHNLWRIARKLAILTIKKELQKSIKEKTERRFKNFQDQPKKMINNILNRYQKKIETTRLIETTDENEIKIITNPLSIKEKIRSHFHNWTATRQIKNINDYPNWKKQYEPKPEINLSWYNNCTTPITLEEIKKEITKKKPHSAPGPTDIPYIILKNLGTKSLQVLTIIFNNILSTGETPQDWKKGTIYPIPKPKEWMGDINITRPITLLETARKLFMNILNNRLATVFSQNKILSPNNWAGLPGGSTQQPIHILNNIAE
jgi:hypothetical protein